METREQILKRFEGISKPLTKTAALGKSKKKEVLECFEFLKKDGEIVNLGSDSKRLFVTRAQEESGTFKLPSKEKIPPTDSELMAMAKAAITNSLGGALRPISLSKIAVSPQSAKPFLIKAVDELQATGEIIFIQSGASKLILSSKAVLRHLNGTSFWAEQAASQLPTKTQTSQPTVDTHALEAAYRTLLRPELGMSMVKIAALVEFLKWSISQVHAHLKLLLDQKRIVFPAGERTVLNESELKAGLPIGSETYYYVRFNA